MKRILDALVLIAILCGPATSVQAADIVIHITGPGGSAEYVLEGASQQAPVRVKVGQTVRWTNDTATAHTASSKKRDAMGNRLFDTQSIASGGQKDVPITRDIFLAAGGAAGGRVEIEYVCRFHSTMSSSLIVEDVSGRGASVRRRDITMLLSDELSAYRDAWRAAQATADYPKVCGNHGCPDFWCHHDMITFLPWHREYVLRMEAIIRQPLHYWDWTSSTAAVSGIPAAFTDSTYVSADGNTYPNPLRSFSFDCGGPQTTSRSPGSPSDLQSLAAEVQSVYAESSYNAFNSNLYGPHGGLHVWVSGQMGATTYAAYDPIFWAHHSNVDRQWASWQQGGGPDPLGGELTTVLFGFNLLVQDRVDFKSLGYVYDRLDPMPVRPSAPFRLVQLAPTTRKSQKVAGIGKTFSLSTEKLMACAATSKGPLELFVEGIPDHPIESYSVYVFVNQPNATPEDAKPENPHYAGFFGVFGQDGDGRGDKKAVDHEQGAAVPRRVLQLFAGKDSKLNEPIQQITLVAAHRGGPAMPAGDIPIDSVSIRQARPTNIAKPSLPITGVEEFTGVSDDESYDAAYRHAVDQAQKQLGAGRSDVLIRVQVLNVEGERGGLAGVRRLKVTIGASVK